jgi:hypothetical protein
MMRHPATLICEGDICAEVGVWKGQFSDEILTRNPKELHLIDPWLHQDYKGRWYSIPQPKMDEIYQSVSSRFTGDSRVVIHRKSSLDVVFPNGYFDWVYIDGNHSYDAVVGDLEYYYPLVKSGGYLCGDDYGWEDAQGGPKPAVDEFVAKYGLKLELFEAFGRDIPYLEYVIPL